MKTRLTSVTYMGFTSTDRRFSNVMLPWLFQEIYVLDVKQKLSLGVEEGNVKAYNENFEVVLVHGLVDIVRVGQVPGKPEELFYLLYDEKDGLLTCFLYRAATENDVTELFSQMREPSPGASSPAGSNTSLQNGCVTRNVSFQQQPSTELPPWNNTKITGNCNNNLVSESPKQLVRSISNASALTSSLSADLSPSDSHFFEVLYVGKVRISHRKVPDSLIDDALVKFTQHEAQKIKNLRRHSFLSSTETSLSSNDSSENVRQDLTHTSTTPLEPHNKWTNVEYTNEAQKPNNKNKKVDQDFDDFTKERAEKIIKHIKPNIAGIENINFNVNGPKNNLGTVKEDEERNEDLKSIISETASSITQFFGEKSEDFNEKQDDLSKIKESNLHTEDCDVFESKKQYKLDPIVINNKFIDLNAQIKPREDSPAPNLNFEELSRKPLAKNKTGFINDGLRKNSLPENKPFLRDRSASIGTLQLKTPLTHLIGEQNRTMLFQVGRSELRLISPDRKQVLLHRAFKDVASCVIGRLNKEHVGFVCRETSEAYACYVFKCDCNESATEVVNAIRQAFVSHADLLKKSREKSPNMTCEHCPMLWYHRLCHDIEGMNDKKSHAFILRRIEQLPDDEQDTVITKYQGGTNHVYETSEHNSFLMMLLRAHCEAKQQRHVHDTAENRSEFLNQYLGGGTIFMKAKRSLSSGFDHLLKRKLSRAESSSGIDIKKEVSPVPVTPVLETPSELCPPEPYREKSMSPAVVSRVSCAASDVHTSQKSPSPQEDDELNDGETSTSDRSPMMDIFMKVSDNRPSENTSKPTDGTWRQAIYVKVAQAEMQDELTPKNLLNISDVSSDSKEKRSKEDLRQLWRMAIDQIRLLIRMEKENERLRESEETSAIRRIKLEYTELSANDACVVQMWDSLLHRNSSQPVAKVDRHMLTQAVKQGVPHGSRGVVWYFLAEQASLRLPPPDISACPHYSTPYRSLLGSLTKQHHNILIDLGRTFPQLTYFSRALGPGQLALYNILKAYSLLDPQVGYCQGLSFVAGLLLLHMDEPDAFVLLRHLMFRRGLRKQYLPDMSALQVQLYQLSRLLRDTEPELHAKLESLDISPALYAAPWMLTLFTSQFPLGFAVRVFDLLFLESYDVVFAVSLALLSAHKDGLMLCESCEEAAEYLKHKLPDLSGNMYEKVMKKVFALDISRQLSDYAVEYSVLREEMPRLTALTADNKRLLTRNDDLTLQLDSALEAINNYENIQEKTENQTKTMEQQLAILSRYITSQHKQDLPPEIKRILQTHNKKLSFTSKISSFSSKFTSDDEDPKKNYKTGLSSPNLFARINKDDVHNAVVNRQLSIDNRQSTIDNKQPSIDNDRKQFMMKKSQSVQSGLIANNTRQFPLKVLEENVEKDYPSTDSLKFDFNVKDLSRKNSNLLNSNDHITQERLFERQLKHDFDENLRKLDNKLESKIDRIEDLNIFQSRKSMSLNFDGIFNKENEKRTIDSGFVTPMTPNDDKKTDSMSIVSHPLSDCDVDIKFDGQSTKLRQIKSKHYSSNAEINET